jgi:hypothetical protein
MDCVGFNGRTRLSAIHGSLPFSPTPPLDMLYKENRVGTTSVWNRREAVPTSTREYAGERVCILPRTIVADLGKQGPRISSSPRGFALAKAVGETNEKHAHPIRLRSIPNHGPFLQNDRQTPGMFINLLPVSSGAPPTPPRTPPIRLSKRSFTDKSPSQCCNDLISVNQRWERYGRVPW